MKQLQRIIGCILLIGALVWLLWPEQAQQQHAAQAEQKQVDTAPTQVQPVQGSQLPVADATTPQLQIDAALRRSFDAWLANAQEHDLAPAWSSLQNYAQQHGLIAEALSQLKDLFERYIGYRQEINEFEFPLGISYLEQLKLAIDVKAKAADRWFQPPEIDAFFTDEFALDAQALQRAEAGMKHKDAAAQIEWLDAYLANADENTRNAFMPTLQLAKLEQHMAAGIQNYADQYDPETLQRLIELENKEADWKRRVRQYLDQHEQLQSQPELSDAQRNALLSETANELFSKQEQRRLSVYIEHPELLD